MQRRFVEAVIAGLLALPMVAGASAWDIDTVHSSAQFAVKHMAVSTVRGELRKVTGTVNLDDKDPTKSTVQVSIDVNTISTGDDKRDGHLKSPDFFDVAKFPTMTFKSTQITSAGADKYKMTGDMTMHGVTKPVVFDVDAPSAEMKDMKGNLHRGITATSKISRKDFGLTWNVALDKGGVMVSDDVQVTVDAELVKTTPAKASK